MATLRELEKQRIEKIKSLNENEVIGYIDILLKDLIKYSDYDYIKSNGDSAKDELIDVNNKLNEIIELTADRFQNIDNAIKSERLLYIAAAKTINDIKTDVSAFKYRNHFARLSIADAVGDIGLLRMITYDLYGLFMISDDNDDVIRKSFVDCHVMLIPELLKKIKSQLDYINDFFYVDDGDAYIYDLKLQMKELIESNDNDKVTLKELGILDVYTALIDETMDMLKLKTKVDEAYSLIAEFDADNVFESYSVGIYNECFKDIPFINVDDFMRSEPKFNAVTGELIEPILSLESLFE